MSSENARVKIRNVATDCDTNVTAFAFLCADGGRLDRSPWNGCSPSQDAINDWLLHARRQFLAGPQTELEVIFMSEPSSFAFVTRSIVDLLRPALPKGVELTSLPASRAGQLKRGLKGRVNVWLYRIEPNIAIRNLTPRPVEAPLPRTRTAFELHYLITAFANPTAAAGPGAEQLLERAISALEERPVLTVEGGAIQVVYDSLSLSELTALWLAAKAEFQLSAAYVARGITIAESQP